MRWFGANDPEEIFPTVDGYLLSEEDPLIDPPMVENIKTSSRLVTIRSRQMGGQHDRGMSAKTRLAQIILPNRSR